MTRRLMCSTVAVAALAFPAASSAADTRITLTEVGPLSLGMSERQAVKTGWLSNKGKGCELASPRPTTYRLDGAKAPKAISGTAEFTRGRLVSFGFTRGVRTKENVAPGKTTVAQMVARYRAAGYKASSQFDSAFQATFVTVKKGSRDVIGGFATGKVIRSIGLPSTQVCE